MKHLLLALFLLCSWHTGAVTPEARSVANYAVRTYEQAMVDSLTKMVSYNTVALEDIPFEKNPAMTGFKSYLKSLAEELGLDFADHDYELLISLGEGPKKFGVITHGDVQPANARKWQQSPYVLDLTSEAGKLVGRGSEDDKGPIATALYAMKAIKDKGIELNRRIELLVYMAEESDWGPLEAFLKTYNAADFNITLDSNYPAVTAEKGWSSIEVTVPVVQSADTREAELMSFSGGSFASQIPPEATAFVRNADKAMIEAIKARGATQEGMHYTFTDNDGGVKILATGKSAHSSAPQDGINAVVFLADALSIRSWPKSTASLAIAYINELVGTGVNAEKFGSIAFQDDFMGPMTLAPTVVKNTSKGISIFINLRRPRGKTTEVLDQQTQAALADWQQRHRVKLKDVSTSWGDPLVVDDAPHLGVLLDVYSHFTGVKDPQPVSIGGSTNAKLFPNALSFGPSMPGAEYTGHSEHEFITREQFVLNLKMYTAVFVELGSMQ